MISHIAFINRRLHELSSETPVFFFGSADTFDSAANYREVLG